MPEYGKDKEGKYIRFGSTKYHYSNEEGRKKAMKKAIIQEFAATKNGYKPSD